MTAFRFRLEKVLEWRRTQLEIQQARCEEAAEVLAGLERRKRQWETAGVEAERQVTRWAPLAGADLAALDVFRLHAARQQAQIESECAQARQRLEAQRQVLIDARRRCELLERLKQQRFDEWQAASDRELEQIAAESYLAGVSRRRSAGPSL